MGELQSTQRRCENLQQELGSKSEKLEESYRARQETEKTLKSKTKEVETLRMKIKEMLKKNANNGDIDADLKTILIDQEVENIKKENHETKKDLQTLKTKVFDLKHMWRAHL